MVKNKILTKRTNKRSVGRPKLVLNEKDITELAKIGCTNEEIATFLKCSHDTLERNFACAIKEGRSYMKMSLRRQQLKMVEKDGNVTMAIWLGKQYLGQHDKQTMYSDHTVTILTEEQIKAV